ncbi:hypothetical protein Q73A0000_05030 [Kaistella flava (ex Peng et al. 2021)]|uniref:RecC C-terminal domain-containing protein n=1 Tax=Kaistella flava (ex Peng et al. 2021) TaxID=2038776 RepID=A0A7M2Y831_9FLAO|nr:exodeoxyribonuclease V subunit gamma [Kaistella flava (ex Peng et al. 2021)]QOW09775.1 hypothetical protein Q73A0000_05030 [Kaistella flava (ex Peng et al. 2021)]
MSIIQYTTTNNNDLAQQFAASIKKENSIFTPIFVGISNNETKEWLVEQVAEYNTISANFVFKKPLQCVEMIHQILGLGNSRKELLQSSQLNWIIFSILKKEQFTRQFPTIANYFSADDLKRFTLAEKIASLFSKYQEFDQNLINKLEDETGENNEEHIRWQSFIWKQLNQIASNNFSSLSKMYQEILAHLSGNLDHQKILTQKIPSLYFYGTVPYTTDFVNFLVELGKYIDIQIFRLDHDSDTYSCRLYETLSGFQKKQAPLFNGIITEKLPVSVSQAENTLLSSVQQELVGSNTVNYAFNETDDSIQITNNYSVYREVEALWNYLITQFDADKNLQQREVCVIIPSFEKYAPAIKAIFGNDHLKFDYSFFNTSYKIQDSPYKALLALYAMDEKEFTSKQVFGLLEYKYIREKFGFAEDLETIKRAIYLANIRHGIDGDIELETDMVSWRYGLKRLVYGGCIENTDELLTFADTEFYPVSEFEDGDFFEIIRLNHFVETLYDWVKLKEEKRSLFDWIKHLERTIENFINIEEQDPNVFNRQLDGLMKVRDLVSEDVPFAVIHYHLKKLFDNLEQSEKIGYGGIRFISPNPNIAVPAKIYCFLGMNGNEFPRLSRKLSFDLLSEEKEFSASGLDKNMFLNLILGAEEKLYISYIGQSVTDNSSIPPSTLIEELTDALKKWGIPKDTFIAKHPLHLFSTKYNQNDPRLIRFSNSTKEEIEKAAVSNFANLELEKDAEGNKIIPLHSLIRFIEDPIRHYYNRVLGIYYSDRTIDLEDCEPFALSHLENWSIKDDLLKKRLQINQDDETSVLEKKRRGKLPFRNFGIAPISENMKEVDSLLAKLPHWFSETVNRSVPINFVCNQYRIIGNIDGVYDDKYLFATVSTDKWKYRIRSLINFMVLTLFDTSKTQGSYIHKKDQSPLNKKEDFENNLIQLCELFERGSSELIHFTSDFIKITAKKMDTYLSATDLEEYFHSQLNAPEPSKVYASEYFTRELKNGFLDEEQAFDQFKTTYIEIIGIVESGLQE